MGCLENLHPTTKTKERPRWLPLVIFQHSSCSNAQKVLPKRFHPSEIFRFPIAILHLYCLNGRFQLPSISSEKTEVGLPVFIPKKRRLGLAKTSKVKGLCMVLLWTGRFDVVFQQHFFFDGRHITDVFSVQVDFFSFKPLGPHGDQVILPRLQTYPELRIVPQRRL